jgi:hypothetical protein
MVAFDAGVLTYAPLAQNTNGPNRNAPGGYMARSSRDVRIILRAIVNGTGCSGATIATSLEVATPAFDFGLSGIMANGDNLASFGA